MNRENKPLFLYTFITVFGGLIVGLNMAGISGAVPFLQEQFMLDDMALGLVVSILTVGCLCGALLGGPAEGNTGFLQSVGYCDRNSNCLHCRLYIAGL